MKRDRKRLSGFYWVRFEGKAIVAEYTSDGLGCSPEGPHWHVPQADECFLDKAICELLSGRLEAPGVRCVSRAEDPIDSLHSVISFSPRDFAMSNDLAWMFGIVCGWNAGALRELAKRFGWSDEDVARLRRLHARLVDIGNLPISVAGLAESSTDAETGTPLKGVHS